MPGTDYDLAINVHICRNGVPGRARCSRYVGEHMKTRLKTAAFLDFLIFPNPLNFLNVKFKQASYLEGNSDILLHLWQKDL